jgi:predicted nucleic acid-binding protein
MVRKRWITTTSTGEISLLFVDTSAWLALLNRKDGRHVAAADFQRSLPSNVRRVTSWGIVAETYTWLRYHLGFPHADRWLAEEAALESRGLLQVVFPQKSMEAGIRRELTRYSDHDLSYVDAFTLHLAQMRGDIDAIFGFDRHLAMTRLPLLPGTS